MYRNNKLFLQTYILHLCISNIVRRSYEAEKRYIRQVKAQDLWLAIIEAQVETGIPYIMYKDS